MNCSSARGKRLMLKYSNWTVPITIAEISSSDLAQFLKNCIRMRELKLMELRKSNTLIIKTRSISLCQLNWHLFQDFGRPCLKRLNQILYYNNVGQYSRELKFTCIVQESVSFENCATCIVSFKISRDLALNSWNLSFCRDNVG